MTARLESTPLIQTESSVRAYTQAHVERFRAPFSLRCGALLIDYILIAGIVAFSTLVARTLGGGARMAGGSAEMIGLSVALIVTLLNFVVLTGLRGQTLGKWATGLRIQQRDGRPVGWLHSLLRHVVGYPLSLLTLGLGFLVGAFNSQGRTLHDLIAGTVVVRDTATRARRAAVR
jgi:uncharacterized RDD family membrane protein YckC